MNDTERKEQILTVDDRGLSLGQCTALSATGPGQIAPTFIRTWLVSSVAMVVVTFVMTFIMLYVPFLVYNVVVSIVAALFGGGAHLVGPSLGEVFSTLAALSAVMVGLVTLIFTVPVMLLKQLSGQFK